MINESSVPAVQRRKKRQSKEYSQNTFDIYRFLSDVMENLFSSPEPKVNPRFILVRFACGYAEFFKGIVDIVVVDYDPEKYSKSFHVDHLTERRTEEKQSSTKQL